MPMLERIAKFFVPPRPIVFKSFEAFATFARRFSRDSVTAELTAEESKRNPNNFDCIVGFSAVALGGRPVRYSEVFSWSKAVLREMEGDLSKRLFSIAKPKLESIKRAGPHIEVSIVALDGDHWILRDDWASRDDRWIRAGKRIDE